jgi:hypothetical protein
LRADVRAVVSRAATPDPHPLPLRPDVLPAASDADRRLAEPNPFSPPDVREHFGSAYVFLAL